MYADIMMFMYVDIMLWYMLMWVMLQVVVLVSLWYMLMWVML